jgi:hypothetical protein
MKQSKKLEGFDVAENETCAENELFSRPTAHSSSPYIKSTQARPSVTSPACTRRGLLRYFPLIQHEHFALRHDSHTHLHTLSVGGRAVRRVGCSLDSVGAQCICNHLGVLFAQTVHDARLPRVLCLNEQSNLLNGILAFGLDTISLQGCCG